MQEVLDEPVFVEENEFPPLIEIEDDETVARDREWVEKTTERFLQARFPEKSEPEKPNRLLVWGPFVSSGVAILVSLGAWLQPQHKQAIDAANDLHANALIDQKFADHHFDSLVNDVATLKGEMHALSEFQKLIVGRLIRQDSDLSKEKFAQNLGSLATAFDAAKAGKVPIDSSTIQQVQEKLSDTPSSSPDYWRAASSLVSYRSGILGNTESSQLPNCWDLYAKHVEDGTHQSDTVMFDDQTMGHCMMVLDDGPQFRNSGFGLAYEANLKAYPNTRLRLFVHDAVIIYSGQRLVPFSRLSCRNCIFKVDIKKSPAPAGQRVMNQLLASNIEDVNLTNSGE